MSLTTSIPRFLLPQRGPIWRTRLVTPSTSLTNVRHASKIKPKKVQQPQESKPIVLEKPAKFNPPSHGSRRLKPAPRYPGPNLSAEEKEIQKSKKYPNMMAPEGSFVHWFLHDRSIHLYITIVRYPYAWRRVRLMWHTGHPLLVSRICLHHRFQKQLPIRRNDTTLDTTFHTPRRLRPHLYGGDASTDCKKTQRRLWSAGSGRWRMCRSGLRSGRRMVWTRMKALEAGLQRPRWSQLDLLFRWLIFLSRRGQWQRNQCKRRGQEDLKLRSGLASGRLYGMIHEICRNGYLDCKM